MFFSVLLFFLTSFVCAQDAKKAKLAEGSSSVVFGSKDCTFSGTFKYDNKTKLLTADLSAIPKDATVFRAELMLNGRARFQKIATAPTKVYPEGKKDQLLPFVWPRFVSLNALEPVKEAVKSGQPLKLVLESTLRGAGTLQVSYVGGSLKDKKIPVVTDLKVSHRKGQTFIVFKEPALETFPEFKTGADVGAFIKTFKKNHPGIQFRIWRSTQKITSDTIQHATLVGVAGPFSVWNNTYHQSKTSKNAPIRYRVVDGGDALPWGTGVYAHNPKKAGKAFYAVTVSVKNEDDFSTLGDGNTTSEALEEEVGLGEPVLQWKEEIKNWMYTKGMIKRNIYTRWESWPHSSTPNKRIDYLVAFPPPDKKVEPAPVQLSLHAWGGSLNSGYGYYYNSNKGTIMIASNQIPYDWWTGYHEANGTRKTFGDGHVRPFTMNRVFGMLDWAKTQWKLDENRVYTAGISMGGSGASMYVARYPNRIAWCVAWVGVHVPSMSPTFKGSYEGNYGPIGTNTMADGKTSPWDYFSDVRWLRNNLKQETGFFSASNGKNDGGIGWPQARLFARALQETRRPHIYNWGMGGHGTRTIGSNFGMDIRINQSLPAFSNCTLDSDIGDVVEKTQEEIQAETKKQEEEIKTGKRKKVRVDKIKYTGVDVGQYNAYLRWKTDNLVDEEESYEITVVLIDKAPKPECKVDLTPRRLQKFKTPSGKKFSYTISAGGAELAKGEASADELDLLTLKQIPLKKGDNIIKIIHAKE